MTIVTTTVDATGMVVTVAGSKTITATVTPVIARMRNTFTIPNAKKIAQYIHGRAMGIVTTTTMSAAVTGTAGIAVGIVVKHTSMITAKSVSAWTLLCQVTVMDVAKSGRSEETATATMVTITVAVTGTAATVVARRLHICIVKIVSVWMPSSRPSHAALRARNPAGKEIRHVMIKTITVVAVGMAVTAVATQKSMTSFTAMYANAWILITKIQVWSARLHKSGTTTVTLSIIMRTVCTTAETAALKTHKKARQVGVATTSV